MNRVCSIFFYEGWLNVAPTVINLALLLSKHGYKVVIYIRDTGYIKLTNLDPSIEVVCLRQPQLFSRFIMFLTKLKLSCFAPTLMLGLFALQILIYRLNHHSIKTKRSISLGVDTNGSILALIAAYYTSSKFVYLSLELNNEKYFRYFDKWRYLLDRVAFRRSDCALIQDQDRFNSLCEYARHKHRQVFYIPNSLSYSNLNNSSCLKHQNFFQEKFKLATSKYPYLVLQAGWIHDLVFSKELATAFNSIDRNFALIFHDRQKRDWNEPYIKMLRAVNSNNLYLSLEPLPYEQIDRVFSSVTIGLAFYRGFDDNFAQIAKASGKLSGYLQHGKPVLMSDLESLAALNDRYQFGIIIKNPADSVEIEQALDRIMSNYDFYSTNALICYKQEFDFETQSQSFLEFITA